MKKKLHVIAISCAAMLLFHCVQAPNDAVQLQFYKVSKKTNTVTTSAELVSALASATAGDTILVAPGTYTAAKTTGALPTGDGSTVNRSWYFRGDADGRPDAKITLKSQDPDNPALLSGQGWSESGYILYITGDYWVVEDLVITEGAKGVILDNSNNTLIKNVEICTIGQEGLHVRDGSSCTTIDGVSLHDIGKNNDGYGEAIYIGSDNSVWWEGDGSTTGESGLYYHREVRDTHVVNCIVGPNVTAEPFDIKEGTHGTIVENCVIHGSGISGINFADSHIDIKGYETIIRYNTFYQDENDSILRSVMIVPRISAGVDAQYTAHHNYIHDNIFNINSDVDIAVANSGSENNYAWNNTRNPVDGAYYNSRIIEEIPDGYDPENTNLPPRANAGSDITAPVNTLIVLDGSASSDPDDQPYSLTYSWTQTDGPDVDLNNSNMVQATFYATRTGEYTFTLTVSDGQKSDVAGVTVTISDESPVTYKIAATAGTNGTISPSGTIEVTEMSGLTFAITPDNGYTITDVIVNGSSVGTVSEYIFNNVTSNQTIEVSFQKDDTNTDEYIIVTAPFIHEGAGSYKWKTASIPGHLNSWNVDSLTINSIDVTNSWLGAYNLPAQINGYYYIEYSASVPWSHIEIK